MRRPVLFQRTDRKLVNYRPTGRPTLTLIALILATFLPLLSASTVQALAQETAASDTQQSTVILNPVQDTYISSFNPTANFGTDSVLRLEYQPTAAYEESVLIQFDLGQIPADASIQFAQLRLYQRGSFGPGAIGVERVTEEWPESSVTWDIRPNTAAALGPLFPLQANDGYITVDVTELAVNWHEDPATTPNYGLFLRLDQSQQTASNREFDSREGENLPQLRVTYTPAPVRVRVAAVESPETLQRNCLVENIRYKDGTTFAFRDAAGSPNGQVSLIHDGEFLFLCVAGDGDFDRFFGVYIDADASAGQATPTRAQISLRVDIPTSGNSAWRGTGDPVATYVQDEAIRGWEAVSNQQQLSFGSQVAEYRIPLSLLGPHAQCGDVFGLAVYQQTSARDNADAGWPRTPGPDLPSSWAQVRLEGAQCPIRVICTATNLPCVPASDVQVIDADTGTVYTVDRAGYVQERAAIGDGDRLWARIPIAAEASLPYTVFHTSGIPQVVNDAAFDAEPVGVMTLRVDPRLPLMTYDIDVSTQWRVEDSEEYTVWLLENLRATSEYLYRYSNRQVALGDVTVHQDGAGWGDADLRIHAHQYMRPAATLGGINTTPQPDPDNHLLPLDAAGEIVYWPGYIRIGSSWNRFNAPTPPGGFAVDVSQDWATVLGHELGHYLLYLRDTYFRIGPDQTIVNVYSCTGSAMGWVYYPENHGFVHDPVHWEDNCRDTYGNDLLNRHEWATLTRFFPWLGPPVANSPLVTDSLPAGITAVNLVPAQGVSPGTPNQPIALIYIDDETATPAARGFLFRDQRIIDQGAPALGSIQLALVGSQVGDRFCLLDIEPDIEAEHGPRRQFGCATLTPGDNEITLRKDEDWAPLIELSPLTTETLRITVTQQVNTQLEIRFFPEDRPGWVEAVPDLGAGESILWSGVFTFEAPVTSGFIHVVDVEAESPGVPRREAMIDFGANGGGLPGPTSSFGHGPVISSSDGKAVYLLTEGVELESGGFIAWQSMLGSSPLPASHTRLSLSYRLLALPGAAAHGGVVSIRVPATTVAENATTASASAVLQGGLPENTALYFRQGDSWVVLATGFVSDPNGETIVSAPSQGVGEYILMHAPAAAQPHLFIPHTVR